MPDDTPLPEPREIPFRPVTFPAELASLAMPWETLQAVIMGVSAIDLTAIPLHSREDAARFLLSYGYDFTHAGDRAEVVALFKESVQFINERFLKNSPQWEASGEPPSPAASVPRIISQSSDPLDVVVMASRRDREGYWACAILKVMHTLSHIENGPYYRQFLQARQQILHLFEQALGKDPAGYYTLPGAVPGGPPLSLYGFEAKSQKTRESTLVKLLCKKGNVAENVTDWVGVRFITHTPADAVRVLRALLDRQVILFPNIIPSRSRNTLLDFAAFREQYDALHTAIARGEQEVSAMEELFRQFGMPGSPDEPDGDRGSFKTHNPASSDEYRSLQITCRHLIRLPQPGLSQTSPPQETRFFIPYEIQILDRASYFESRHGASAHQLYKQKQIATARRRVLGPLLTMGHPNEAATNG